MYTIEKLRHLLIGIRFTIVSDCQALTYLNLKKTTLPQVARWHMILSEYDFDIRYRPGTKMSHVDCLSRAAVEEASKTNVMDEIYEERLVYAISCEEEVAVSQQTDEHIQRLKQVLSLKKDDRTKHEKKLVNGYKLKNGLVYKVESNGNQKNELFLVPKHMRKGLVIKYHDLSGHNCVDKTIARIRSNYYFAGMKQYVTQHVKMCIECILSKNRPGKQQGLLNPIPPGKRPFEVVHVDHLGPFVASTTGNKYVLLAVDNLTKFVTLWAVKNTTTAMTINRLEKFVSTYGAPMRLISDRGTSFTAHKFGEFCDKHGIRHTLNSSRHPRANGLVERVNQTLIPMLQITAREDGRDWDKQLEVAQRNLNTAVNKTTGKTPFEALYGYIPSYGDGASRELIVDNESYNPPNKVREQVRQVVEAEQKKYKNRHDKHKLPGPKYELGDVVYMKVNKVMTGESTKLQRRYRGPLIVTKILPADTYEVTDLMDHGGRPYLTTAHVSQLKLWKNHAEEDILEDQDAAGEAEC